MLHFFQHEKHEKGRLEKCNAEYGDGKGGWVPHCQAGNRTSPAIGRVLMPATSDVRSY